MSRQMILAKRRGSQFDVVDSFTLRALDSSVRRKIKSGQQVLCICFDTAQCGPVPQGTSRLHALWFGNLMDTEDF